MSSKNKQHTKAAQADKTKVGVPPQVLGPNQEPSHRQTTDPEGEQKTFREKLIAFLKTPKGIIEVVGLIALVWYTHRAGEQLSEMKRSVDVAERQFKISERPWIEVATNVDIYRTPMAYVNKKTGEPVGVPQEQIMKPGQMFLPGRSFHLIAHLKNSGHSPALRVHVISNSAFLPLPTAIEPGFRNVEPPKAPECEPNGAWPQSNIALFPNDPYTVEFGDQLIMEQGVKLFESMKAAFYAFGCVKYADQLGDSHQTDFCSFIAVGQFPNSWRTCRVSHPPK